MRAKVRGPAGNALYALRKATVEPVFGQIQGTRRFRRFSFSGLGKVQAEWQLISLTQNLLKLFRAQRSTADTLKSTTGESGLRSASALHLHCRFPGTAGDASPYAVMGASL